MPCFTALGAFANTDSQDVQLLLDLGVDHVGPESQKTEAVATTYLPQRRQPPRPRTNCTAGSGDLTVVYVIIT